MTHPLFQQMLEDWKRAAVAFAPVAAGAVPRGAFHPESDVGPEDDRCPGCGAYPGHTADCPAAADQRMVPRTDATPGPDPLEWEDEPWFRTEPNGSEIP